MNKFSTVLLASVAIATFASQANANSYTPYVGVSYNYMDLKNEGFANPDLNAASLLLGTTLSDNFSSELFFDQSNRDEKTKTTAYGLDLIANAPIACSYHWNVLATAGVGIYDFDYKGYDDDKFALGYRFGAGIRYTLNNNWDFRALARYVTFDKEEYADNMMEYSLSAIFNF